MKRSSISVGVALLLCAPLLVVLPGCGGGSSGIDVPAGALGSAPVNFGNGQTGSLALTRIQSNGVSGILTVNPAPVALQSRSGRVLAFAIPPGRYPVSGTFSPPRGYALVGTFPAPLGEFSITGNLPTTSQNGSYTISTNGQSVSGVYPRIGSGNSS